MRDEEIDRALAAEEEIVPSSGFSRAVMAAVKKEAGVPPPIPFPWKRLAPGILLGLAPLAALLWVPDPEGAPIPWLSSIAGRAVHLAAALELPLLLGVAALTLAGVSLGRRLAQRRTAR